MSVKKIASESEFRTFIRGFKPVVIDFFATWCGPCKAIAPKLEELASGKYAGKANFGKVDVDELGDISHQYKIEAMPTFIVFANGTEVGRVKGGDLHSVERFIAEAQTKSGGGGRTLGGGSAAGPAQQQQPSAASGNIPDGADVETVRFLSLCPQATPDEAATYLEMAGGEAELAAAIFASTNPERTGPAPAGNPPAAGSSATTSSTTRGPARPTAKPSRPQEYFAGGGQNSGTAIIGPDRGGDDDGGDLVGGIIDLAKRQGQEEGQDDGQGDRGHAGFQQPGRRLGHTEGPSLPVQTGVKKEKTIKIAFYRNGVVVEDGPLRPIDDPETKAFLQTLKTGMVPPELAQQYPNTDLSVAIADHHDEDFVQKFKAFQGEGNSLQSSSAPAAAGGAAADVPLEGDIEVDDSQPVANIALQLLDNTRMEVRLNPGRHTLNHVRTVAQRATPNTPPFELWARDIPPRPLRDLSQTIEAAKVGRCVLFMKKK